MTYSKNSFIYHALVVPDLLALALAMLLAAAVAGQYETGFDLSRILGMRFSMANIKGLAPEVLATWDERRLMQSLFDGQVSTAAATTLQAGRGVGMALVKDTLQTLAARLKIQSAPGKGTVFQLALPLTATAAGAGRYAAA